jgi:predicted transglutaminase-like cysteine proteinase
MFTRFLGALVAGYLAVSALAPALAGTAEDNASDENGAYAPVHGRTLPPIGFVDFCARNKKECEPIGSSRRVSLTPSRWDMLRKINAHVNSVIEPVSDQDLYAVPERWDYPIAAGDCEDYVLLKKRYLQELALPAESLAITVVLDEAGEGHAVLMVMTDEGDFVLDNRRSEILRWSQTNYRFLKRQSQEDPRVWVAFSGAGKTSLAEAATKRAK